MSTFRHPQTKAAYQQLCENGAEEWVYLRNEFPAEALKEAMLQMAFNLAENEGPEAYDDYVAKANSL